MTKLQNLFVALVNMDIFHGSYMDIYSLQNLCINMQYLHHLKYY